MKVEIIGARDKKPKASFVDLTPTSTVAELKAKFHGARHAMYPDRQCFLLPAVPASGDGPSTAAVGQKPVKLSNDEKELQEYGLRDAKGNYTLEFKDLGPQIGWQTVFLVEYAGPLVVYPLVMVVAHLAWQGVTVAGLQRWLAAVVAHPAALLPAHPVQQLALACWVGHYLKRELETLFVHRFSHGSMPLMNIFKNSGYYWGFAAYVSYFVNHPLYTPPECKMQVPIAFGVFLLAELGNFWSHMILRNLRRPGTRERKIPRGFLFEYVSCPNYTFEIIAWIAFGVMTQTVAALLFALVGALQMTQWGIGKHRNYLREFGDKYPRSRRIIIPFIF